MASYSERDSVTNTITDADTNPKPNAHDLSQPDGNPKGFVAGPYCGCFPHAESKSRRFARRPQSAGGGKPYPYSHSGHRRQSETAVDLWRGPVHLDCESF
jgi:hypothetical protein